ncbi:MAG TPA: ABC transporter permease [Gemmatimonadaceae bacterium]|nr:ABC transporter permease [Gemmatimonadaceae bacterium]
MRRSFRIDSAKKSKQDVEREIALHIDLRAKEFEAMGMSPQAARDAAREAFGDQLEIESEVRELHDRTLKRQRSAEWMEELRQDLRVGFRMLRRSPAFAIVAVLTLAVGIGANTAIFSVLRSVLLRPLPYASPAQLVQIWSDHRALGRAEPEWLTPPDFIDLRDGNSTFSSMAAYYGWGPDITGTGDPESLRGLMVSGNYFSLLGTSPAVGRLFSPSDDDAAAPPVVVLSHAFWTRRFGSDRAVIGKVVTLSGNPWTVVGILPPDFRAPVSAFTPDVFRPIRRPSNSTCGRGCITVRAIGRLKPGVSLASAQADLALIDARLATAFPQTNAKVGSWLIPLHEQLTGSSRPAIVTLTVAVGLVLLIGCINLANLLLVRAATRAREIGVRAALGAGRGRLVRQLLTESALLAFLGGFIGLLMGIVGSRLLATLVPEDVRRVQEIGIDSSVLLFTVAITFLSAALFGIFPALQAVRTALINSVRGGREGASRAAVTTRGALVVTQLAMAVMLLVGAGLLLRSFVMMQKVDLGYRAEGVAITGVTFPGARYPTPPAAITAIEDLLTRLRAQATIRSAEATDLPVLAGNGDQDISAVPIGEPANPQLPPSLWIRSVTAGYLKQMRMRLVAGRQFTADDRAGVPLVGIINHYAAERYFPGKDPIGRMLSRGNAPNVPPITIVGVVASGRHDGPNQPYKPELFVPIAQRPSRGVAIVIEPARDLTSASQTFARSLREVDPLIPVSTLAPIETSIGDAVALPRLYATLVGIFATAALLLAALGVYGVMAYAVSQRQRELGVRMALGAEPGRIRRMILGQGGKFAAIGLGVGVAMSMALGQLLSKLLFGVTPFDVPTLLAVPAVLGAATLAASWLPARRAMRLDPVAVIRQD